MSESASQQCGKSVASWVIVLAGASFVLGLLVFVKCNLQQGFALLLGTSLVGGAIAAIPLRSFALFCEFAVLPIVQWLCLRSGVADAAVLYVCLVAAVLASLAYELSSRYWAIIAWLATLLWFWQARQVPSAGLGMIDALMLASAAILLLSGTLPVFIQTRRAPRSIDVILCSFSGNTAHYTAAFVNAAQEEGAEVVVHRFHHYRRFQPTLTGEALVVSFPVIGWKPPWPLFNYLLLRLPWGNGKPAFAILTSAGGPENAAWLTWLLLTLRGYRVLGRSTAVYPISLPTVRLGPERLCRLIDSLMPWQITLSNQARAGREFAQGRRAGIPLLFWPSPLFLLGVLLDNKVVDVIYRNHVIRRRCKGCGLCVRYCPAERLRMEDGFPKAGLVCTLCFGCVNHCPQRAMQMWFLTEYGNRYTPKCVDQFATEDEEGDTVGLSPEKCQP